MYAKCAAVRTRRPLPGSAPPSRAADRPTPSDAGTLPFGVRDPDHCSTRRVDQQVQTSATRSIATLDRAVRYGPPLGSRPRPRLHPLGRVLGRADDAPHGLAEAHRVLPREVRAPRRHLLRGPLRERRALHEPVGERLRLARSRSACGTTRQTRPISRARSASNRSPVSSISIAFDQPIRPGSRIAPTIVGTPSRTSGKPNSADVRRDHEVAARHRRQPVAEAVAVDRGDRRLPELEPALERVDRRDLPEAARPLADRAAARPAGRRRRRTPAPRR